MIGKYIEELMTIETYFQVTIQPGYGLDYCGVTLIPPNSLIPFKDIIKTNNYYESQELELFIQKVSRYSYNKYLIHFGIWYFIWMYTDYRQ